MDSANTRIDGLVREIQDVKANLQYSQKDIDEIKQLQGKIKSVEDKVQNLAAQIADLSAGTANITSEKMDYLENQSLRNNILIDGLSDKATETWEDTERKVCDMLNNNLKLESRAIEIEHAHRTGKFRGNSDKPHSVFVKLLRFKDKQLILSKAKSHLKNTHIYINEDFADVVRKKRADLVPALKEARARSDYAFLSYDRL